MKKSSTDLHWDDRARAESDPAKVNIADTVQRDLELKFIWRHLDIGARLLEIGCGNGYVTEQLRNRVSFVDAFDYSEDMIAQAQTLYGERNNRFFQDNVLDPRNANGPYDAAICIRVLINLRNLEEQKRALSNISSLLKRGGKLLLIEGYRDGFETINEFREQINLPPAEPAPINFYSSLAEMMPSLQDLFVISDTFHTGLFDFLTRIVYPTLVGAQQASEPGIFHSKIEPIVSAYEGPDLARFARLHGFLLIRR